MESTSVSKFQKIHLMMHLFAKSAILELFVDRVYINWRVLKLVPPILTFATNLMNIGFSLLSTLRIRKADV